jgi:hypothetical protein
MNSRVERLLRWVWLVNGVLLLALLVLGVLFVAGAWIVDLTVGGDDAVSVAPKRDAAAEERPTALRYGPPEPVRGTATRIVLIRRGQEGRSAASYGSGSGSARSDGPIVNVGFVDAGGGRLLLDRPAYVSEVRWPGTALRPSGEASDSLLRWVVYRMALEDGNGDGRLDHRDPGALYVSALDGSGLRRVLPDGYGVHDWEVREDGSLYVSALQAPAGGRGGDEERLPQRAFLVGADGQARPYAAVDSLAVAAARVLGK